MEDLVDVEATDSVEAVHLEAIRLVDSVVVEDGDSVVDGDIEDGVGVIDHTFHGDGLTLRITIHLITHLTITIDAGFLDIGNMTHTVSSIGFPDIGGRVGDGKHLKVHEEDRIQLLGEPFTEVHEWLAELFNPAHRRFRHNRKGVEEVRKRWGDHAAGAAEIHIERDGNSLKLDNLWRDGLSD